MDNCCNLILVGVAADGEKPGIILFHERVPGFKTADWTILDFSHFRGYGREPVPLQ